MLEINFVPVEPTYGVIGHGRLATQLCHYFTLKGIQYHHWFRQMPDAPEFSLQSCDVLLIAIKDDAIVPWLETNQIASQKPCIHFSGTLQTSLAAGYHPLMTFSTEPLPLDTLEKMLFVSPNSNKSFQSYFPQLTNPCLQISADDMPFYHALCVMANNFSTLLWQKFFDEMEQWSAPTESTQLFLKQTFHNIIMQPKQALTGPIARHDTKTILSNLDALKNDSFISIYQGFLSSYQIDDKSTR